MGIIENEKLQAGERVVLTPERSKTPLFWAWVVGVLFCWFFFIPLIKAIRDTKQFAATEYVVTDRRLVVKCLWPKDAFKEKDLASVEKILVKKNAFGFGTLTFAGKGGENIYFVNVKNPEDVQREVEALSGNRA